jgi:hypothetical protein
MGVWREVMAETSASYTFPCDALLHFAVSCICTLFTLPYDQIIREQSFKVAAMSQTAIL